MSERLWSGCRAGDCQEVGCRADVHRAAELPEVAPQAEVPPAGAARAGAWAAVEVDNDPNNNRRSASRNGPTWPLQMPCLPRS